MKSEFPGFFPSEMNDIDKMWDDCIFVLDANVLLDLYRYSDLTREKLLEVFEALGERLWIPHQVAFEYLNNRLTVIGEQGKIYDDAVKKVEVLKKSLESHNQHPFVSEETLNESLAVFARLVTELTDNKRVHDKRINSDEIKEQLGELFEGRVGRAFDRESLEDILKEGQIRYEQRIPPGFCDVKKMSDSVIFEERCRPYGDYIVWLQILDKAKLERTPVVFVTGDSKEDWWSGFQGKTLGPQPKLIEEFLSVVGSSFYMYSPDRFLERASEYLNKNDSEEAVKEIRDIRVDDRDNMLLDLALNVTWPKSPGKWRFDRVSQVWVKDGASRLRDREEEILHALQEIKTELNMLTGLHASFIAMNVDRDDDGFRRCVETIRHLSQKLNRLESDLELVRRELVSIATADAVRTVDDGVVKEG
ncbi:MULTISPECIES: PIN-like domain-containing protein [unclassified Pseudomonas]|uniref:PIN-like domain-containing protein n=1 Tax=unclassified Pseudomonas TaxID=196821 RepID=UPI0007034503|nr:MULTISPECIES: PIN-like domain-containing protein [unclassified Pseudomonas]KRA27344.1 hypothetical protein ASD70_00395 [Pseudomonas sp. Root569]